MIRLDEKDRGIIEDFWSKGGDERMHMTPKNLSGGQCWKIVRLSRSPVPREFALDYGPTRFQSTDLCAGNVAASARAQRQQHRYVARVAPDRIRLERLLPPLCDAVVKIGNLTLSHLVAIGPPARINLASDKSVV